MPSGLSGRQTHHKSKWGVIENNFSFWHPGRLCFQANLEGGIMQLKTAENATGPHINLFAAFPGLLKYTLTRLWPNSPQHKKSGRQQTPPNQLNKPKSNRRKPKDRLPAVLITKGETYCPTKAQGMPSSFGGLSSALGLKCHHKKAAVRVRVSTPPQQSSTPPPIGGGGGGNKKTQH